MNRRVIGTVSTIVADPAFLLDTNICIYVLEDAESVPARRLADCESGSACVSAITAAELWKWSRLAEPGQLLVMRRFFELLPILPFDESAALAYAQIPFRRGSYDRLIAAHALPLHLVLVTNNERDFGNLPGLKLQNWTVA
jgi:tRNA(fMet)-specific endonuclease VapC